MLSKMSVNSNRLIKNSNTKTKIDDKLKVVIEANSEIDPENVKNVLNLLEKSKQNNSKQSLSTTSSENEYTKKSIDEQAYSEYVAAKKALKKLKKTFKKSNIEARAIAQREVARHYQQVNNVFQIKAKEQIDEPIHNQILATLLNLRTRLEKGQTRDIDESSLPIRIRAQRKLQRAIGTSDWRRLVKEASTGPQNKQGRPLYWQDYTVEQLVLAFNELSINSPRRTALRLVLKQIIENFDQTTVWLPEQLSAIAPLAACNDLAITKAIFNVFLARLQNQILIDPALVAALAELVRYANYRSDQPNTAGIYTFRTALDADDIVKLLDAITLSLTTLQEAPSTQGKLASLLQTLGELLSACVDQKLCSNAETLTFFTEKTRNLSSFLEDLLKSESGRQPIVCFYAWYAKEALARVPDKDTPLTQYLGCALKIGQNTLTLASTIAQVASSFNVSGLLTLAEPLLALKDSIMDVRDVANRYQRSNDYEALRLLRAVVPTSLSGLKTWHELEAYVLQKVKPSTFLTYGILLAWLPVLNAPQSSLQRIALFTLARLSQVDLRATLDAHSDATDVTELSKPTEPAEQKAKLTKTGKKEKSEKKETTSTIFPTSPTSTHMRSPVTKFFRKHILRTHSAATLNLRSAAWHPNIGFYESLLQALEQPALQTALDSSLLGSLSLLYRQLLRQGIADRLLNQPEAKEGLIGRLLARVNQKLETASIQLDTRIYQREALQNSVISVKSVHVSSQQFVTAAYQLACPVEYHQENLLRRQQAQWAQPDIHQMLDNYVALKTVDSLVDYQTYVAQPLTHIPNSAADVISTETEVKPLLETLHQFLKEQLSQSAVVLVHGAAGNGKSLTGINLIKTLQQQALQQTDGSAPLALFIPLGQLQDPTHRCIEQFLEQAGWDADSIAALKADTSRRLILWLDGYDEIKTQANLYETNELAQWHAKVIITARLGTLPSNYRHLFQVHGQTLRETFALPFDGQAIYSYLNKRAGKDTYQQGRLSDEGQQKYVQTIIDALNAPQFKALLALVQTPFLLKIIVDVLPALKKQEQAGRLTRLNRSVIYQAFLAQWYINQAKALHKFSVLKQLASDFDVIASFQSFGEDLSVKMLLANQMSVPIGNNIYRSREEVAHDIWDWFFNPKRPENLVSSQGVPLRRNTMQAQFLHRSILENYVASALLRELRRCSDSLRRDETIQVKHYLMTESIFNHLHVDNKPLLPQEISILEFLREGIDQSAELIAMLNFMLDIACHHPEQAVLGANTITLLNYLRVPLQGRNLQGLHAPYANLEGAVLDHTDLSNANLQGASLREAWLHNANLRGAQLTNTFFSEQTYQQQPEPITQAVFDKDRNCIYSSAGTSVRRFDLQAGTNSLLPELFTTSVTRLALSSTGHYLAASNEDQIKIWDLTQLTCLNTLDYDDAIKILSFVDQEVLVVKIGEDNEDPQFHFYDAPYNFTTEQTDKQVEGEYYTVNCSINRGRQVFFGNNAGNLHCLSLDQFPEITGANFIQGLVDGVICLALHPQRLDLIALGIEGGMILVADLASLKVRYRFRLHKVDITALTWSNNQLIAADKSGLLSVWDAHKGNLCQHWIAHKGAVSAMAVHPGQPQLVITSGEDKYIYLWDLTNFSRSYTWQGHQKTITTLFINAKSLNEFDLISTSLDGTVRQWPLAVRPLMLPPIVDPVPLKQVVLQAQQKQIFTVNEKNIAAAWAHDRGLAIWTYHTPSANALTKLNPNGNIIVQCDKRHIRLYSIPQGTLLAQNKAAVDIQDVMWTPNGQALILITKESFYCWRENSKGQYTDEIEVLPFDKSALPATLTWHISSPEGQWLLGTGDQGTMWIGDVSNWDGFKELPGHLHTIRHVCFDETLAALWTGSDDKTIRRWNLETQVSECLLSHPDQLTALVYDPKYGVLSGDKSGVRIHWALDGSMQQFWSTLSPASITALCWDKSGKGYVYGSKALILGYQALGVNYSIQTTEFIEPPKWIVPLTLKEESNANVAWFVATDNGTIQHWQLQTELAEPFWLLQASTHVMSNVKQLAIAQSNGLMKKTHVSLLNQKAHEFLKPNHTHLSAIQGDLVLPLESTLTAMASYLVETNKGYTPLHLAIVANQNTVLSNLLIQALPPKLSEDLLYLAINYGRVEAVKLLIAKGVDINKTYEEDQTLLHIAVTLNEVKVIEALSAANPNLLEAVNQAGNTPLFQAIWSGHLPALQALLTAGSPLKCYNNKKQTPLHLAAERGFLHLVKFLLEKAVVLESHDKNRQTPLHTAAYRGNLEIVKLLLKQGAQVDAIEANGRTSLHLAAQKGHLDVIDVLLSNKAHLDWADKKKRTPLFLAIFSGSLDTVNYLIAAGANINIKDDRGQTPFYVAASYGHSKIVESLLLADATEEISQSDIDKAFYNAVLGRHKEIAELLIAKGADIECSDESGYRPLHIVAQNGDTEIAQALIKAGADLETFINFGWTPLFIAARFDHCEIVRMLLENGAEIDHCKGSWGPLHDSAEHGRFDAVKTLLEYEPNVNMRNENEKFTPLFLAARSDHHKVVEILLQAKADFNIPNVDGYTPLQIAIHYSCYETVKVLLKEDVSLEIITDKNLFLIDLIAMKEDVKNGKPIVWSDAKEENCIAIVKLLLQKGATLVHKNMAGNNLLHRCAINNLSKLAKFLLENGINIAQTNNKGQTASQVALENNHEQLERTIEGFKSLLVVTITLNETVLKKINLSSNKNFLFALKRKSNTQNTISEQNFDNASSSKKV